MKIAIVGACGRLGTAVCEILQKKHEIFKIDLKKSQYSCLEELNQPPDVIVDASCAAQSVRSAAFANILGLPIVIACTGHDEQQLEKIVFASQSIPVFLAYNMSVGVQVFKDAAQCIAESFESDVHIHEIHHKNKKDAPSGTAKEIKKLLDYYNPTISYARGGNVIGTHEIDFFGEYETITLTHTALSRSCFANGVAAASEWIVDKPNGIYGMRDLTHSDTVIHR